MKPLFVSDDLLEFLRNKDPLRLCKTFILTMKPS